MKLRFVWLCVWSYNAYCVLSCIAFVACYSFILQFASCRKEQRIKGVLPSEFQRADSGVALLGREQLAPPAMPRPPDNIPVRWGLQAASFAMLLWVNSHRSPSIWQQGGCANPPGGPEITCVIDCEFKPPGLPSPRTCTVLPCRNNSARVSEGENPVSSVLEVRDWSGRVAQPAAAAGQQLLARGPGVEARLHPHPCRV